MKTKSKVISLLAICAVLAVFFSCPSVRADVRYKFSGKCSVRNNSKSEFECVWHRNILQLTSRSYYPFSHPVSEADAISDVTFVINLTGIEAQTDGGNGFGIKFVDLRADIDKWESWYREHSSRVFWDQEKKQYCATTVPGKTDCASIPKQHLKN